MSRGMASVSVTGATYDAIAGYAVRRGVSMSSVIDRLAATLPEPPAVERVEVTDGLHRRLIAWARRRHVTTSAALEAAILAALDRGQP